MRRRIRAPISSLSVCIARSPRTSPTYVSECLDSHPNMYVDIAARIGELVRQPHASRKFFDKYQDRIVFGTDAIPKATNFPQQVFEESLYEIYYRFLFAGNFEDEVLRLLDCEGRVPPQGPAPPAGPGPPPPPAPPPPPGQAAPRTD